MPDIVSYTVTEENEYWFHVVLNQDTAKKLMTYKAQWDAVLAALPTLNLIRLANETTVQAYIEYVNAREENYSGLDDPSTEDWYLHSNNWTLTNMPPSDGPPDIYLKAEGVFWRFNFPTEEIYIVTATIPWAAIQAVAEGRESEDLFPRLEEDDDEEEESV